MEGRKGPYSLYISCRRHGDLQWWPSTQVLNLLYPVSPVLGLPVPPATTHWMWTLPLAAWYKKLGSREND
jgi:hypothetical protein